MYSIGVLSFHHKLLHQLLNISTNNASSCVGVFCSFLTRHISAVAVKPKTDILEKKKTRLQESTKKSNEQIIIRKSNMENLTFFQNDV